MFHESMVPKMPRRKRSTCASRISPVFPVSGLTVNTRKRKMASPTRPYTVPSAPVQIAVAETVEMRFKFGQGGKLQGIHF